MSRKIESKKTVQDAPYFIAPLMRRNNIAGGMHKIPISERYYCKFPKQSIFQFKDIPIREMDGFFVFRLLIARNSDYKKSLGEAIDNVINFIRRLEKEAGVNPHKIRIFLHNTKCFMIYFPGPRGMVGTFLPV